MIHVIVTKPALSQRKLGGVTFPVRQKSYWLQCGSTCPIEAAFFFFTVGLNVEIFNKRSDFYKGDWWNKNLISVCVFYLPKSILESF